MSERGFFVVDRGVWDHPMFAPEPFTEREAWMWMISAAAWADTRVRVGTALIEVKRGQLAFATRFLAQRWRWGHSKVVRFLFRLQNDTMVSTEPKRQATLITICNYNEYQLGRNADETQIGTPTGTEVKRNRNKEEETNNLITKEIDSGASAPTAEKKSRKKPVRAMPDIFPMSEAQKAYAEKRGYKFEIPPCFAFNKTRPGPAQEMFEAFKNHHVAKGSTFADWDAAWRTWVDNQVKWDTQKGKPPGLRPAI